jgi:predicted nucleic acid-binding protein
VLDTSVIIDIDRIDPQLLPMQSAISTHTLAELAVGPHSTNDPVERGLRQERLQKAESAFEPLAFDIESSRAYGRISVAIIASGRRMRDARAVDLLIAATACAHNLPLYTRNPRDFEYLDGLVEVVSI